MLLDTRAFDQNPYSRAQERRITGIGGRNFALAFLDIHIVPRGLAAIQLAGAANLHGWI
jgi:hypothetical protein